MMASVYNSAEQVALWASKLVESDKLPTILHNWVAGVGSTAVILQCWVARLSPEDASLPISFVSHHLRYIWAEDTSTDTHGLF